MRHFTLALTLLAAAPVLAQSNTGPGGMSLDRNTAGPRVDLAPTGPRGMDSESTLVSGKKPRFALKKNDEIVAIDGLKTNPIEAAAKVHTDDSKIKTLTVRRNGKTITLKPTR